MFYVSSQTINVKRKRSARLRNKLTLREKCPNTVYYKYILFCSVFSPTAGKYGREETPYLDTFHAVPQNN